MAKKKDKDANAVALGRKGGKARRNKLTPERRKEIASKAARARWSEERIGDEIPIGPTSRIRAQIDECP